MLKEYMASLGQVRKLSIEEERRLWKACKEEGNEEARQRIIESYQLLVCREAMKYAVQETVKMDLLQEGMVGLMEAADRFDPSLGIAFSLYAVHRIRGRIQNFLGSMSCETPFETEEEEGRSPFSNMSAPDLAFEMADQSFLHTAVDEAVQRLPAREQDVIRHVFIEERSAAETASSMEVSTAYVYRLEKKGIRRLRGMLSRLIHERK